MSERISRVEMWLEMAETLSKRSTCPHGKVGAVITTIDGKALLSTGYNGSPPGAPHCDEVGCILVPIRERERCVRTIHAELNAALRIQEAHQDLAKALFSTHMPCFECIKVMSIVHVEIVYFRQDYNDDLADRLANELGIELRYHPWPKSHK